MLTLCNGFEGRLNSDCLCGSLRFFLLLVMFICFCRFVSCLLMPNLSCASYAMAHTLSHSLSPTHSFKTFSRTRTMLRVCNSGRTILGKPSSLTPSLPTSLHTLTHTVLWTLSPTRSAATKSPLTLCQTHHSLPTIPPSGAPPKSILRFTPVPSRRGMVRCFGKAFRRYHSPLTLFRSTTARRLPSQVRLYHYFFNFESIHLL